MLSASEVKEIQTEYLSFSVHYTEMDGATEWYSVELTPMADRENLSAIIDDINSNNIVTVVNGGVYHSKDCTEHHSGQTPYKKYLDLINPVSFKIAIFDRFTSDDAEIHRPDVFVIQPEISMYNYPYHPHLNWDTTHLNSLCFLDDYQTLPQNNRVGRILSILDYASIWLLRHQIWKIMIKDDECTIEPWIGPSVQANYTDANFIAKDKDEMARDVYFPLIQPKGKCRCGSGNLYEQCCMISDLIKSLNIPPREVQRVMSVYDFQKHWNDNVRKHQVNHKGILRQETSRHTS